MITWLRYAQLAQLRPYLADAKKVCKVFHRPWDMLLLDDEEPIDVRDQATSSFFKLVKFNHQAKRATLATLKERIADFLYDQLVSPSEEGAEKLNAFFECRHSGAGWNQLDRIFMMLIGQQLTDLVDASTILVNQQKDWVEGKDFFNVTLRLRSTDEMTFRETKLAAIAPSLDHLLPLVQQVLDQHAKFCETSHSTNSLSKELRATDHPFPFEPFFLVIYKNQGRFMAMPIIKSGDTAEYLVDWGRADISEPCQAVLTSISKVAPPRSVNKLKGRFLEDELGL
jgi:hypothetical protein